MHRSIGVSNFNVEELTILINSAKVVPAVNQVRSSFPSAEISRIKALSLADHGPAIRLEEDSSHRRLREPAWHPHRGVLSALVRCFPPITYSLTHILYSSLQHPGGAVDVPVNAIATRLGVTAEEVLLAWAHEKVAGGIVITSSTKKERLERYINAGDLRESCLAFLLAVVFSTLFLSLYPCFDKHGLLTMCEQF